MYHSNPWDRPEAIEAKDAAGRAPKHNPERVDVGDRYEVRRWCQRFLCTEATLRQAVGEDGDDPSRVQAEVKRLG